MRELVGATEAPPIPADLVAAIATEREQRLFGFCIYGGEPCRGLTCRAHRDLLYLDPNTYAMRLRTPDGAYRKGI